MIAETAADPLQLADVCPADGQFIHQFARILPGPDGLPYVLARFQLTCFAPQLFAQHAIDFPVHIRNSVPKRQAEFIAGRICAQSILATYGLTRHGIPIGNSREPLWPSGFIGSITHNGRYAAAVACPRGDLLGVGIDIETIVNDDARQAMVELVVSPEEAAYLRRSDIGLAFDCMLTLVFSAKESFFKAAFAHVQQYIDFDAVNLVHIDPVRRVMRFRCVETISPRLLTGQEFHACYEFVDSASIFTVVLLHNDMALRA